MNDENLLKNLPSLQQISLKVFRQILMSRIARLFFS